MKLLNLLAAASLASAAAIDVNTTLAQPTPAPQLEKRYQKVRLPKTTTSTTTEIPKPWIRTIYESVVEIVTPTVIQGVTFSAKPPTETDLPQPWVSLDKKGLPKTIVPKIKNGRTEKASPTYSTYFQTATTVTYSYEDLKAHNMDPDQKHEELIFTDEDKTYVSLNPLIRCTPDRYSLQGKARDKSSAPFCTPHENQELSMDKTYFFTWFTKHFGDEVEKVRLHFSYVKESLKQKGMKKRDVDRAFFTTEWIKNLDGYYPFEIQEEWLLDKYIQNVGVSIQPDNISDDDFDLMTNATVFKIMKAAKVVKKPKEYWEQDEGLSNDGIYYIIGAIPTVIVFTFAGMYFFLFLTRNDRDISGIRKKAWKSRHKVLGKFKPSKKNKKYSELPTYDKEQDLKLS